MNPRPSLCMVIHGPYPLGEARATREARAAVDAGWDVEVVALRNDGESHYAEIDGTRVHRLPVRHERGVGIARLGFEYTRFLLLATIWLARSRRYDVVQVHNPPDFLIGAAISQRVRGSGVVFDVHDRAREMFEMRFPGRLGSSLLAQALHWNERRALRFADAVITVHNSYADALVANGSNPRRTHVVMNSLDEALLPQQVRPAARGPFRIVHHGTVTPHYAVDDIVRAAARLRRRGIDVRVEVYGDGDGIPSVRVAAQQEGMEACTSIAGRYLPQREVLALIADASVGVIANRPIPRNSHVLPAKLLEYVALGVPVVAADLPTIRAHFSTDELRYFRAGDVDALADALLSIAVTPSEAVAQARRARKRYKNYRWERQAQKYLAVLEDVLQSRRSAPSRS